MQDESYQAHGVKRGFSERQWRDFVVHAVIACEFVLVWQKIDFKPTFLHHSPKAPADAASDPNVLYSAVDYTSLESRAGPSTEQRAPDAVQDVPSRVRSSDSDECGGSEMSGLCESCGRQPYDEMLGVECWNCYSEH
jgi:hypothetical protein